MENQDKFGKTNFRSFGNANLQFSVEILCIPNITKIWKIN